MFPKRDNVVSSHQKPSFPHRLARAGTRRQKGSTCAHLLTDPHSCCFFSSVAPALDQAMQKRPHPVVLPQTPCNRLARARPLLSHPPAKKMLPLPRSPSWDSGPPSSHP